MITAGAAAPDFALDDTGGARYELAAALAQGPVLLFFLKDGCATTELAAPILERLWRGFTEHVSAEGTKLSVLAISQDGRDAALRIGSEHGWGFPVLLDAGLAVSRAYELEATPTLVLLRGVEKLRADADRVAPASAYSIADVVEGWSREGYELLAEEIAARIGGLPPDLFSASPGLPAFKPG